MLKRIKRPLKKPWGEPTEIPCPDCGTNVRHGSVRCPKQDEDPSYGCLVMHYGHICPACGQEWSLYPEVGV